VLAARQSDSAPTWEKPTINTGSEGLAALALPKAQAQRARHKANGKAAFIFMTIILSLSRSPSLGVDLGFLLN
jgi:hypothetical protein